MKISDLKPCACCGGPLLNPPVATWYVIRLSQAMLHPRHAREVVGLTQIFNGAMGLAEGMAPAADKAVMVLGDEDPGSGGNSTCVSTATFQNSASLPCCKGMPPTNARGSRRRNDDRCFPFGSSVPRRAVRRARGTIERCP